MRTAPDRTWRLPDNPYGYGLFAALGVLTVGAVAAATATTEMWILGVPFGLLLFGLAIRQFTAVFFILIASLPLSVEVELAGGLATDLVSEPLMWLLTLVSIIWYARHWPEVSLRMVLHPIALALWFHLAWISITMITSEMPMVSFKYLLAKGWYVIVFFLLAGWVMHGKRPFLTLLWAFFIPLIITVSIVLVRHAMEGFTFEGSNYVMGPFYRNHVIYACVQAIFLPFIWFGASFYPRWSFKWWVLVAGILLLLVGINFAYTRAAYVALVAAFGVYWVIRWRLMKVVLVVTAIGLMSFYVVLSQRDNWLLFAPDFERTITHSRFDNLLEATTRLEDISTMERVYRWVAASYMVEDKPVTGFGPGTFYFFYKNYTVSSFKTYVSDNPERSGIHNYFLMTTVEQGLPGLVIFFLLVATVLLTGEHLYHRIADPDERRMLLAAVLSFALINLLMLMNDLVETDKIGAFFFMNMAMIIQCGIANIKPGRTAE
jgi:O-antigen ligase